MSIVNKMHTMQSNNLSDHILVLNSLIFTYHVFFSTII